MVAACCRQRIIFEYQGYSVDILLMFRPRGVFVLLLSKGLVECWKDEIAKIDLNSQSEESNPREGPPQRHPHGATPTVNLMNRRWWGSIWWCRYGLVFGKAVWGLLVWRLFGLLMDIAPHTTRGSTSYAAFDEECHPTGTTLTLRLLATGASHLGSRALTQIYTHTTAFFFLGWGYWP